MNEIWKPVDGFPGYEVSNLGRVRSFKRYRDGRILKQRPNKDGYLRVKLCRDGKSKQRFVHRLVALAFIDNPENKPEVNHDDGDKTNCRVENLWWATKLENQQHAFKTGLNVVPQGEDSPRAKLTNEQVRYIRDNPDNLSMSELAEMFCITVAAISDIQRNKRYKTAGGKIRKSKYERIPDEIREQIKREYKKGVPGHGCIALAKKYGISPATVLRIVNGRKPQPAKSSGK